MDIRKTRLHPLVAIASVAVILFSVAGLAAHAVAARGAAVAVGDRVRIANGRIIERV